MKKMLIGVILLTSFFGLFVKAASASLVVDIEGGKVFPGYNDVRIPGDTGTKFSLYDEVETDPAWYWRIRAGYLIEERHFVSFLIAPLKVEGSGKVDRPVTFEDATFSANAPLQTTFQFNTYRLGYRYNFLVHERGVVGGGVTLLVRDAYIEVEGDGQSAKSSNLGFVPLLNFHVSGKINPYFGILFEGDALASSQGRAFDILTALAFYLSDSLSVKVGYRFIEGGADNDKVYTFSLFHFATMGIELKW